MLIPDLIGISANACRGECLATSPTGLGMEPQVEEAYAAVARRDRLNAIDEAL